MIDFGTVKPGTTLYIPFSSFASSSGASITLTGLAVTDIEVYKNGGTTQRSSDNGYTLLDTDGIDFDGITGIHGFSINLADNSDAGFYAAGADYFVVVSSVTVDSQTVSFIAARFRIGYPGSVLDTTIATLSSQTSFTLTSGPAEDDALNDLWCVIHDVASAVQLGMARILDYTGSTKTVTLAAGTTFTAAATDNISVMGPSPRAEMERLRLDELLAADSDIDGAQPPTVGSVFHELMTKTTGSFTYDQTTDSLEATADAIAAITLATGAGDFTTKTADSATLTTGSTISGSYTDTATNDDVFWITAPVTPAVGGFGLRQQLVFNLPLSRIPVNIVVRGWWNGTGAVDVYALNSRTAVFDKLTNTGTNLASRTTELLYTIPLPRDYADDSGGSFNIVTLEFRATSTTTANRLRLDQVLVSHLDEDSAVTLVAPTVADIWSYADRTLTSPGAEPQTFPANFESMVITSAGGVLLGDGLAHGGTIGSSTATLALKQIELNNPSGGALRCISDPASFAPALYLEGYRAAYINAPAGAEAIRVNAGGSSAQAVLIQSADAEALYLSGGRPDGSGAVVYIAALVGPAVVTDTDGSHDIILKGDGTFWDGENERPVSVRLADATDHGGTTATLRLGTSGSDPAFWVIGGDGPAVQFGDGDAGSHGLLLLGGTAAGAGHGLSALGASGGCGVSATGEGSGEGVWIHSGDSGHGMRVTCNSSTGENAVVFEATGSSGFGFYINSDNDEALRIRTGGGSYCVNILDQSGSIAAINIESLASGIQIAGLGGFGVSISGGAGSALDLSATGGYGIHGTLSPTLLTSFFTTNSGTTYASSVAGSVVKEIADNAATDVSSLALEATSQTILTNVATVQTGVTTLLSRITATIFSGITSLAQWLGLIAGKQTGNTTARTELRATGAGSGTFDETTDSTEAIRDRGDAAWTTATGFSTLTQADVRSAVGLASANLDTQLTTITTNVAAILDDTGTTGVVVASGSKTGYSLAAAGLDAVVIETGLNARQAISISVAALAGKLAGAATTTVTISAAGVPATNRITATVTSSQDRTAVTLNPPA